jgi:ribosomal protein S9
MKTMNHDDPAAPEPLDEATEMEMLRMEVYESMKRVQEYRAGNTELMGALMLLMGGGEEARAGAMKVLVTCGMADENGALNWLALAARKENRWTWEHCVRTLVKDPATVERLLALDDDPTAD